MTNVPIKSTDWFLYDYTTRGLHQKKLFHIFTTYTFRTLVKGFFFKNAEMAEQSAFNQFYWSQEIKKRFISLFRIVSKSF